MLRRFSVDFAIFSMLADAGLVMLALRLAVVLRPSMDDWFSFARPVPAVPQVEVLLYPAFALVWVLMLLLFSVYDGRRNFRVVDELTSLTAASVLAAVSLAGFLYLSYREYSRVLFLSFAVIAYGLLVGVRFIYRILFRLRARENTTTRRRVLILGAGPVGRKIAEQIHKFEGNGLELAGFLDDDPLKLKQPNVLGRIDQVVAIIREQNIEEVIIALPSRVWSRINTLVSQLHELPVRVWVAPDYYTLALHRARVEELAGIPLIDLRAPALDEYQRLVKRIFDLVLTIIMMPLVLPVMGIIAVAIRLDSPGPVIFRQTRVGENGRLFQMLKFRSMVKDAEKMRHVIESMDERGRILQDKRKPDPRVTRVGRFLRRTSLDELPQLFNVLKGEMSLVGPRPELPHLVDQYELWQRRRFAVPQGITGWWQVNGRSDKPMHQHTEDDLYYVQNYSLWLDIMILFKTLLAVLRRKGAY
ncbi:MAG: polyprenyl glycosylphosphotransferase [Bacteroidia bacterium]|nr:MAG: polyprenyl glycosylphosphotransferase [Bacteroidia bacterium]